MMMLDSIIQIKIGLDEIRDQIPILGKLYYHIRITLLKHKINKIKDIPLSSTLLMGFYKFILDVDMKLHSQKLDGYIIYINPDDEVSWLRTIKMDYVYGNESVIFSVHSGNMIDVSYTKEDKSYNITVKDHLANFEYTSDREFVLSRSNFIGTECIIHYIETYLER